MNHIRGQTETKYSLHAKQTILSLSDWAYLCKNFNFLLTIAPETSQQTPSFIHSTAVSVQLTSKISWKQLIIAKFNICAFDIGQESEPQR